MMNWTGMNAAGRAGLACLLAGAVSACGTEMNAGGNADMVAPGAVADMASGPADLFSWDAWRPVWKDDAGCNLYEHFEPATGRCEQNNIQIFKDEKSCWDNGPVNAFGVGMPCQPGVRECPQNQKASCCRVDDMYYGAMCTFGCTTDADCGGAEAWCSVLRVCMPRTFCQTGFTDPAKPKRYRGLGFPCSAMANDQGVGQPCTLGGKECQNGMAKECLGDPGNLTPPDGGAPPTSFCTKWCNVDADCGTGAMCIYSSGRPFFCAPSACAGQFANVTVTHGPPSMLPSCQTP